MKSAIFHLSPPKTVSCRVAAQDSQLRPQCLFGLISEGRAPLFRGKKTRFLEERDQRWFYLVGDKNVH